ncbi:hypothetical protein [Heyndrickxia acidicola]|uniref:Uncharacterized protein n=1 Tax=Heyndrickxia acidicola TaxID=209389 RepID=A0ABU6MMJ0_9BACI|nr:hypothetical protein [Heyndrickxia acidicola]MED1205578.1 hypothetical protein [Heyndrickxia acidicola]
MRVNLFLSPEDLRNIKLIYTSYLPKDGENNTEIEMDSVLMCCLDKVHD